MFLAEKRFADGRTAAVVPLTYGRARLTVSQPGDAWGYDDAW